MATILLDPGTTRFGQRELIGLRDALVKEKRRLERLLAQAEKVLNASSIHERNLDHLAANRDRTPNFDPLDQTTAVKTSTADLRVASGNLSADRIAKLYGISVSQLASWLGRTKQAVSKTPDAASLQNALGFFERVARLRLLTKTDAEFRKWLRSPHASLNDKAPLDVLAEGKWQAMADYVAHILIGTPG